MSEHRPNQSKRTKRSKPKAIFVRRRIFLLLFLFIIFFFIVRGIVSIVKSNLPTTTVVEEVYRDEEVADAFIIKTEHVQKVSNENLKYKVKDGEKVAKGETIATARVLPTEDEKGELEDLGNKISIYEELFENYKYYMESESVEESDLSQYIEKLKSGLEEKDLTRVEQIESDILEKQDNNTKFFEEKINSFKKSRDKVLKESGSGNKEYKAEISGLFSKSVDGFEKELSLKNIEKLDFDKFKSLTSTYKSSKNDKDKNSNYTSIKIVDNTNWYALVKVNIDYKRYLEGKHFVNFSIPSTKLSLKGTVIDTKENDREMLLLLQFNERLHDIYEERYVTAKIEKDTYDGLKVPSKSVVERDGTTGVYVKDISGIVRFCPINIKYRDKDYAIVKKEETSTIKATLDGKVQDLRTLKLYDEVLNYGSLAKENSILN